MTSSKWSLVEKIKEREEVPAEKDQTNSSIPPNKLVSKYLCVLLDFYYFEEVISNGVNYRSLPLSYHDLGCKAYRVPVLDPRTEMVHGPVT